VEAGALAESSHVICCGMFHIISGSVGQPRTYSSFLLRNSLWSRGGRTSLERHGGILASLGKVDQTQFQDCLCSTDCAGYCKWRLSSQAALLRGVNLAPSSSHCLNAVLIVNMRTKIVFGQPTEYLVASVCGWLCGPCTILLQGAPNGTLATTNILLQIEQKGQEEEMKQGLIYMFEDSSCTECALKRTFIAITKIRLFS
jgi:hypothetical protein